MMAPLGDYRVTIVRPSQRINQLSAIVYTVDLDGDPGLRSHGQALQSRTFDSYRSCLAAWPVGIGGDPINGSSFLDHLALLNQDPKTKAVIMIGEIGGPQEAEEAAWIKANPG